MPTFVRLGGARLDGRGARSYVAADRAYRPGNGLRLQ